MQPERIISKREIRNEIFGILAMCDAFTEDGSMVGGMRKEEMLKYLPQQIASRLMDLQDLIGKNKILEDSTIVSPKAKIIKISSAPDVWDNFGVRGFTDMIEKIKQTKFHHKWPDNKVFLVAGDSDRACDEEIIITESLGAAFNAMQYGMFQKAHIINFHVYDSYDDAYKAARDMRESNKLCYSE